MAVAIAVLIAGFFMLIKGADYLVDGASSIAKKWGIPALVIGLTIVAFGTSAPELVVNLLSASKGNASLAVGNVMGSNLANILLILGVTASLKAIKVERSTVWREIPFMLLAALMVLTMAADVLLDGSTGNVLSRTNGLSLLGFFVIFMYYTAITARRGGAEGEDEIKTIPQWKSWVMIVGGLAGLVIGGNLIVDNAVFIATSLGVSEALIGLTIVAVGTSLPELATSIAAVRKGSVDLAVGNVVGSNIFNIFFVLGSTATVAPLAFSSANLVDAAMFVAASLLVFASIFVNKSRQIERWQGAVFVGVYAAYIAYSIAIYA